MRKEITIVSNNQKASLLMQMLLSEKHNCKSVILKSKQYLHTSASIDSDNLVLFIGNNGATKDYAGILCSHFDKYGMKYSWRGTKALLEVHEPFIDTSWNEFSKTYIKKYSDIPQLAQYKWKDFAADAFFVLVIGGLTAVAVHNIIKRKQDQRDVKFAALITEFIFCNGFESFLKGVHGNE